MNCSFNLEIFKEVISNWNNKTVDVKSKVIVFCNLRSLCNLNSLAGHFDHLSQLILG